MTISSSLNKHIYVGNGTTTTFDYTFDVLAEDDLHIFLIEVGTGTETELTSNFTVTPSEGSYPSSSGTVTYPSIGTAITSAYKLAILRTLDVLQPTVYPNNTSLKPKVVETSFDRITMIAQQQQEQIDRAMQFAISVPDDFSRVLPAPVALKALRINSDATGFEYTTDPETAYISAAASAVAAATSATNSANSAASSASSATQAAASAITAANSAASVNLSWKNPMAYGAIGDGVTDDTAAIQSCIASNTAIFIPSGYTFLVTNILIDGLENVRIFGEGTLKSKDGTTATISIINSLLCIVKDIKLQGFNANPSADWGFNIDNSAGISLINLDVYQYSGTGVSMGSSTRTSFPNDNFQYPSVITGCRIRECGYGIFHQPHAEYWTISNNEINLCSGIGIVGGLGNTAIIGNQVNGNVAGCMIDGTFGINPDHGIMIGNIFNHNQQYGLLLQNLVNGESVIGNACYSNIGAGTYGETGLSFDLVVNNAKNLIFEGNQVGGGSAGYCIVQGNYSQYRNNLFRTIVNESGSGIGNSYEGNNCESYAINLNASSTQCVKRNNIEGSNLLKTRTLVTAFQNDWLNYDNDFQPLQYWKDDNGMVHIDGVIKNATAGQTIIFTLPTGYRPAFNVTRVCSYSNSGIPAGVRIYPGGNVQLVTSAGIDQLDLSDFTFMEAGYYNSYVISN